VDTALSNTPRFADYIRPVWQRRWLVLAVVILATAGTYARAARQPDVYTTGTLVFYQPAGDPLNGGASFPTDRTLEDVAGLLYADSQAVAVARRIRYQGSPSALLAQVTISDKTGQDFIAISASSRDPAQAATIANGYAQQLVAITNADEKTVIGQELAGVRQQLDRIPNVQANQSARATLQGQLSRLQLALSVPTGTKQVSPATVPSLPTSPKPKRDALFAFVLSLVLAISVAFGLERFDRRLKRPEDLERAYSLPILAVLPHSADPSPRADGVSGLGPGFHEAFGLLRTNIQLLTLDDPPRSIVVISAIPGEGKSTLARNLAISMSEAGKRVLIIEADLRRPMQSGLFGVAVGPGLTDVLTGVAELGDVTHEVGVRARGIDALVRMNASPAPEPPVDGFPEDSAVSTVSVILAGSRPANPATVLESDRLREVLDELRDSYDLMILDSAPLLSVTDSVPLVRYADAAIVVGRLDLTTRDSVRRMTAFLARMPGTNVLGVVANDLSDLDSGEYAYGYGYGYGYGGRGDEAGTQKVRRRHRVRLS
jgi:Mrp family chromosome partitioning ATPase